MSIYSDQFKRSLAIMKKDILIYYLKGPVIIFGILIPLFLFLAFLTGSKNLSTDFLVSGLIGMTMLFTATSVSPVITPWESQMNTLERLMACPISIYTLIMGDLLASVIFGFFISLVPVLIGILMGVIPIHFLVLLLGIMLASVCFSALGLLLATPPTNAPSNVMMISSLVKFPLVFISGIFIPLENLPYWGKIIASLSPLTYFTDLTRYSLQKVSYYPLWVDFVAIIIFTLIFFVLAVKIHKKTLPMRI
ncbi:ABC transporter permease [Methanobacterium sp. CWC-01]|uniref:ABC transporter permease n=1 Tax=Methanobacterium aridiramus TaxID=2584467 RepID=UPI0025760E7C|nr:ABC transporter permease [Methanobacterium sp. CWC-01]WJI10327.1 ABC transporter permease [Methanobacterium sp. CWC-01]